MPRAWVLPGGHIDLGESLEQGVIRELLEETGIEIEISAPESKASPGLVLKYKGQLVELEPFFVYESSISHLKKSVKDKYKVDHFSWINYLDIT
jgi:8-oxo-dGTP pyrophosphatase MutT (NUDIX family)